jgi:hypothetical protein
MTLTQCYCVIVNRHSLVSKVTCYWLEDCGLIFAISVWVILCRWVSGSHPALDIFPSVKWAERQADHSPSLGAKLGMRFTLLLPCYLSQIQLYPYLNLLIKLNDMDSQLTEEYKFSKYFSNYWTNGHKFQYAHCKYHISTLDMIPSYLVHFIFSSHIVLILFFHLFPEIIVFHKMFQTKLVIKRRRMFYVLHVSFRGCKVTMIT